ncbi:hypothetical protein VaNZ11_015377 [Volvox africanus]|uniref:Translation initiation factor 3 C-terminal domain-containing protein n=1 Tax=Volvox africanus TaxID=51714 RepID=A0ABQ5SKE4_9CHLO|nr:hypothetical protein VaNZ11_015377 [Volvox africanus]
MAVQAIFLRPMQCPAALLSSIWQLANFDLSNFPGVNSPPGCLTSNVFTISSLSGSHPGQPGAPQSYLRHSVHHSRIGAPIRKLSLAATAAICRVPCPGQQQCRVSSRCPGTLLPFRVAYTTWRTGFAASSVNAKRASHLSELEHNVADSGRSACSLSASRAGGVSTPRPKAEPVKEMHLKPRIAEHDLGYKLRQLEGWLADGIRAKVVVEFRSADQSDAAAALVDSVVSRLAGKGQALGSRQQNKNTWFVVLRPPVSKIPKQAKQQQSQAQQQQLKGDTERQGSPTATAA